MWWCENTCVTAVVPIGDDVITGQEQSLPWSWSLRKQQQHYFPLGSSLLLSSACSFTPTQTCFQFRVGKKDGRSFKLKWGYTVGNLNLWPGLTSQRRILWANDGENLERGWGRRYLGKTWPRCSDGEWSRLKLLVRGNTKVASKRRAGWTWGSYKQLSIVMQCFSCSSRSQDYVEAKDSARKICEKKGLSEFCKCQCQPPWTWWPSRSSHVSIVIKIKINQFIAL